MKKPTSSAIFAKSSYLILGIYADYIYKWIPSSEILTNTILQGKIAFDITVTLIM